MEKDKFWNIIEASRKLAEDFPADHAKTLQHALEKLDAKEIVDFDRIFREYRARAYTWDLWGAAYLIGGGCSDDGFMDFRAWLISKGETVYHNALENPDSLAEVITDRDGDAQVEVFNYVSSQAWERKLSKRYDEFPQRNVDQPGQPIGEPWEEDGDELAQRFPKLYGKFG